MNKIANHIKLLLRISILLLAPLNAYAHDGKLGSRGCHSNGKIAGYHCHEKGRHPPENSKKVFANNKASVYISGSFAKLFGTYDSSYRDSTSMPGDGGTLLEQGYLNKVDGEIGFNFAIISAIGIEFKQSGVRAEIEYSYRRGTVDGDANNSISVYEVNEGDEILDASLFGTGKFESITTGDSLIFQLPASGKQQIHSLMINLYKDFKNKSIFTPYLGAGLGVTLQKTEYTVENASRLTGASLDDVEFYDHQTNETKAGLGTQGMLGVTAVFTDTISMNLGYRIFNPFAKSTLNHSLEVGVRFSF